VGTILATLAKLKPRPEDREHLVDHIFGAGAPIAQRSAIEQRFGVHIVETYGQTETAGCYTKPVSLPQRPGSIGRPTSRFEARLGPRRGTDSSAELLIRPLTHSAIFDGYLRPDGSVEWPYDADGWYHTGDLARVGDDGDFEFVVRERESIRRRGEIIASVPIEEAAVDHPDVAEAAAIAVPTEGGVDEEIKLIIVPAAAGVDPAAVHAHLRHALPRFMVPRYIEVIDQLPKTASTRVQKFLLNRSVETCFDARHRSGRGNHKPR
jgi:carnitine-CoA ligase